MSLPYSTQTDGPDVLIAGAGIIGLSIALELHGRGHRVTVLERDSALGQASVAAAGMLAAHDPHNPPALLSLARYSLSLYRGYLERIERLSGLSVPFQTEMTVQYAADGSTMVLDEQSIDPRQLAGALLAAVRATSIELREHSPLGFAFGTNHGVTVGDPSGLSVTARQLVLTLGAWSGAPAVVPRKGQMLRVQLRDSLRGLRAVHRNEHVYVVPRTQGPQAGSALIGATVEDAGFDTTVHAADLGRLRALAAELVPGVGDAVSAPELESWAGLRPATADGLPVLGRSDSASRTLLATGHYRNGVLLAPATAVLVADMVEGVRPALDVSAFAPHRVQALNDKTVGISQ